MRRSIIVWEHAALEVDRALRAALPHRSTQSMRLIRRGGAWRVALIIILMAACIALGALLHGGFLATNEPPRPATTAVPR